MNNLNNIAKNNENEKNDKNNKNCSETVIINGWEYLTDIKPNELVLEQKLQDSYLMQYNLSYHKFIKSLCIDKDNLDSIVNKFKNTIDTKTGKYVTRYRFLIDTSDDNDVINFDDNYPIKFLKSKFINFKLKKIKTDLITYYKPLGFYVKGPFELSINKKINKYFIELCWNNENNENNETNENILTNIEIIN